MGELQEKHAAGTNEVDDPDRAPTGTPYRQIQQQQQQATLAAKQREAQQMEAQQREETERETWRQKVYQREQDGLEDDDSEDDNKNNNNDSDDDDEYDDLLDLDDDDDPVLEAIRHKRMLELKIAQTQRTEALAKGHGQYRTISQDELLPECAGSSEWVAIHFFHREFERCAIMDHHLQQIAPAHVTCKFLRIDAEKAPFLYVLISVLMLLCFNCFVLVTVLLTAHIQQQHTNKQTIHYIVFLNWSFEPFPPSLFFMTAKLSIDW